MLLKCENDIQYLVSSHLVILQGSGKWYELQDLHVADILPQMITLSESYIQVNSNRRHGFITYLALFPLGRYTFSIT